MTQLFRRDAPPSWERASDARPSQLLARFPPDHVAGSGALFWCVADMQSTGWRCWRPLVASAGRA